MWPLVTYSNYFKIVSTVTFLDSQTGLISGTLLYYCIIYTMIQGTANIWSAWFLDIVISTCYTYTYEI